MADSRPGSTDAVAADADADAGVHGLEDWELVPGGGDGCREDAEAAPWEEQLHCCACCDARDELIADTNEGRRNTYRVGCFPVWLLPWAPALHRCMYGITYGYLPLISLVHVMLRREGSGHVPPPTEKLWIPAFFVLVATVHVAGNMVFRCGITEWMRLKRLGAPFGLFLLIKLFCTYSLFFPAEMGTSELISGITMIWWNFVKAVTLDVQEDFRKCLGPFGSLARTPADLHNSSTSIALALCREPFGQSRENLLRAGACLYEILSSSENGEPIQVYHDNFGQHMQSFVRENGLGACLWVFALCVLLLEGVALFKMLLDDILDVVYLYKRCITQMCGEAATCREAFHEASLECLRRTHYPLTCRFFMWCTMLVHSTFMGHQEPSSRLDLNVADRAPSRAAGGS